jgi:hypothetical protein
MEPVRLPSLDLLDDRPFSENTFPGASHANRKISLASQSTPWPSKSRTTASLPFHAAQISGGRPRRSLASTSTPWSSKSRTIASWPFSAAQLDGVRFQVSLSSRCHEASPALTPQLSKTRQVWDVGAAVCKARLGTKARLAVASIRQCECLQSERVAAVE